MADGLLIHKDLNQNFSETNQNLKIMYDIVSNNSKFLSKKRNKILLLYPFSKNIFIILGQRFVMMEEKIVLASILRRFNIKSTQLTDDIKTSAEIILKSTSGIMVKLETRHI